MADKVFSRKKCNLFHDFIILVSGEEDNEDSDVLGPSTTTAGVCILPENAFEIFLNFDKPTETGTGRLVIQRFWLLQFFLRRQNKDEL